MRLILLLLLFFQDSKSHCGGSFCAHQKRSTKVTEGKSVTTFCEITYPGTAENASIRVHWYESDYGDCSNGRIVYNSTEQIIYGKYKQRLVPRSAGRWNQSVTIRNLSKTDGPVICCQVDFRSPAGSCTINTSYGTHLLFSDQIWLDQLDSVAAWPGETVTIPCHVNLQHATRMNFLKEVTWSRGRKGHEKNAIILSQSVKKSNTSRFSLVNFPHDISLNIINIETDDRSDYCCSVTINVTQYNAKHSTELLIQETNRSPELSIDQHEEASAPAGVNATIPCTYGTSNTEPMDVVVSWRAGSRVGSIAFHPTRWMVHPAYRVRTSLTQRADLQIMNVTVNDNNTYYCIVTLKFCDGNQTITTSINYGTGTRFTVTDGNSQPMKTDPKIAIIISCISIVLLVIVLIGILCYVKGWCRKQDPKISAPEGNVNDPVNTRNLINVGEGDGENDQLSGGIVYAQLNMSDGTPRNLHQQSNEESRIIYANIKR